MSKRFSLEGRVALVSGAAGILGPVLCEALAQHGAAVALTDVAAPEAQAADLAARYGVPTAAYALDLRDPEAAGRVLDDAQAALGPVDVFLGNAASKGSSLPAFFSEDEDFPVETWREIMSVNLDGLFFATRAAGKRMAARGRGSIVLTSSIYGIMAPDQRIYEGSNYLGGKIRSPAVYSASKAGVVGLTRHFATLWGDRGVRVNAIAPGGIGSGQNGVFQDNYSRRIPLGRMATAEDMTGAVVFLASDAASYVTGQVIAVDGGLSAW